MSTKLIHQEPFTEQLLADAGISPGMHVLDLGCGEGGVSFLLAKMVGDDGKVLGIDRNGSAVANARKSAERQGLSNTAFTQLDLSEPLPENQSFDVVVARRVLMYLPNPVDTLRRVCTALRSGGIAIFQEADATLTSGRQGNFPLHAQLNDWMWQTVASEGANIHMGFELPKVLEQAGLKVEHVRAAADMDYSANHSMFAIAGAMQWRIVQQGVATESELDMATLEERLETERNKVGSIYVRSMTFGAWARKS